MSDESIFDKAKKALAIYGFFSAATGFFAPFVIWRASVEPMLAFYFDTRDLVLSIIPFFDVPSWLGDYMVLGLSLRVSLAFAEAKTKVEADKLKEIINVSSRVVAPPNWLESKWFKFLSAVIFRYLLWPISVALFLAGRYTVRKLSTLQRVEAKDRMVVESIKNFMADIQKRTLKNWVYVVVGASFAIFLAIDFLCQFELDSCAREPKRLVVGAPPSAPDSPTLDAGFNAPLVPDMPVNKNAPTTPTSGTPPEIPN